LVLAPSLEKYGYATLGLASFRSLGMSVNFGLVVCFSQELILIPKAHEINTNFTKLRRKRNICRIPITVRSIYFEQLSMKKLKGANNIEAIV